MIDWVALGLNGLWIAGLAVLLAALSYHRWLAHERGGRLRDLMLWRSWKVPFAGGMLLVCAGVAAGVVERGWERVVWWGLAAFYAVQLARSILRPDRSPSFVTKSARP